jgi:heptosyltransferase-3
MKILVIQLARLGDIYMSWPTIRALKTANPGAEIHMLVRSRFSEATNGLESVSQIKIFPTPQILDPVVNQNDLSGSLGVIDTMLNDLNNEKYDLIVNLTFSEVSSYVASFLQTDSNQVLGYTRHSDGFLSLKDDISRYFWAQVGPGGANQIHLMDLMAGLVGVELAEKDFRAPDLKIERLVQGDYFVIHLSASEEHKQLSVAFWKEVIQALHKARPEVRFVLVGTESEKFKAEMVMESNAKIGVNLVGQTKMSDLFGLLYFSDGLLGTDSAPMHMLPFVNQRGLCFSVGDVNHFETGPATQTSVILRLQSESTVNYLQVKSVVESWVTHRTPNPVPGVYFCGDQFPRVYTHLPDPFSWKLLKALYMAEPFPLATDLNFYQGALKMYEVSHVSLQNLSKRKSLKKDFLVSVLDRVDDILAAITKEVPALYPYFRWYQAEKTRVQPGTFEEMCLDHILIAQVFQTLLKKYLLEEDIKKAELHGSL